MYCSFKWTAVLLFISLVQCGWKTCSFLPLRPRDFSIRPPHALGVEAKALTCMFRLSCSCGKMCLINEIFSDNVAHFAETFVYVIAVFLLSIVCIVWISERKHASLIQGACACSAHSILLHFPRWFFMTSSYPFANNFAYWLPPRDVQIMHKTIRKLWFLY